ncbi:hypothetical protein [Sphingomonas sp.]|jgi:hypothetical protein|uniref:hypothetical protein n=1 Tax=Sphingomonas sp. TaxID=28214 RepID=UPI002E3626B1|nr:hypothetical protein [Sphingomonas sp.]HEX4693553.1 hypothetical protein [Sphingomonas sp.]
MHQFSLTLDTDLPPIQVLVAQFSSEQTLPALLELIYDGPEHSRRRASAIVLRPAVTEHFTPDDLIAAQKGAEHKPGSFIDAVAEACATGPKAFERFDGVPIFVLHSDNFAHRLSGNINPGVVPPSLVLGHLAAPRALDAIRDRELNEIVERSRAILMPVEGSYYDPPSAKPIRSFLRVGNIQYSRQAVDAIAFWLLPHVAAARAILIDTWSISSLAFNLSRILTLYDGRTPIPVEMLTQYQDRSSEAQAALLEALDRLWSDCPNGNEQIPVTCIVSATQTGSLVGVLRDEIETACLPIDMSFVALFKLGKTDALPPLCDLSEVPEFAPLTEAMIEEGSAIHIDPQVYFPLVYQDVEFELRIPLAKNFGVFVERFGTRIVSAHRDQVSDGSPRHHAVHLDMAALIDQPAFIAAFESDIAGLDPPPKAILTPQHDVARILGERAQAVLAAKSHYAVHLQHPTLHLRGEEPLLEAEAHIRDTLATLGVQDSLLILDDCFITGDRLTGYQMRLRQLNVRARLNYRVAVARPDDMQRWAQCRTMLGWRDPADKKVHARNSVEAIHEICLPNWQETGCPWCAEAAFYRRMLKEKGALPAQFQDRLDRLNDRDNGLVDDLFLVPLGAKPLTLYRGSIFLPPSAPQATVFAAISSALQQMRTVAVDTRPRLGPRRYPIATVLTAHEYLQDVYKDSILRAAVLRAARGEELRYTNERAENERTAMVEHLLISAKPDESDLTLELILAHAGHKCRIDTPADDPKLDPAVAAFLADVRALLA